jgi:hypothetical protein
LHEAIPDWETDPERARAYVCSVLVASGPGTSPLPRLR